MNARSSEVALSTLYSHPLCAPYVYSEPKLDVVLSYREFSWILMKTE